MMSTYRLPYFCNNGQGIHNVASTSVEKHHDHFMLELVQATSRNKN
uniref:Uncharacterized protein n=1 Tax=Arundo donax TaxID=35708 RepID=A0A0A9HQC5_ARUDO